MLCLIWASLQVTLEKDPRSDIPDADMKKLVSNSFFAYAFDICSEICQEKKKKKKKMTSVYMNCIPKENVLIYFIGQTPSSFLIADS